MYSQMEINQVNWVSIFRQLQLTFIFTFLLGLAKATLKNEKNKKMEDNSIFVENLE
jgi:hypothetical protein